MKAKTLIAGIGGSLVVAVAGATVYGSMAANQTIDQLLSASDTEQSLTQLSVVAREQGLLSSTGTLQVSIDSQCFDRNSEPLSLPVQLHYSIDHLPGVRGFAQYEAHFTVDGEVGEQLRTATGGDVAMRLAGELGFNGEWANRFSTPAVDYSSDGARLVVAASTGEYVGDKNAGAFAWKLPVMSVSHPAGDVQVTGVSMAGRFEDIRMALGNQTFAIENISATGIHDEPKMGVNGLRFDYETRSQDGLISTVFKPSLAAIETGGQSFEDLSMTVSLTGLDEQALREINALTANQCQTNLQDEQLRQIEENLLRLIDRGASFSVTDAQGRRSEDRFGGEMRFTLGGVQGDASSLANSLEGRVAASAILHINQALVPEHLKEMAVSQGLASLETDILRASFSFSDGGLLINGTPDTKGLYDTATQFLAMGDSSLVGWRDQVSDGNGPLVKLARAGRM